MPAALGTFEKFLNPVFVETGTYYGAGISAALAAGFASVHSIELSPSLYFRAWEKFRGDSRVKIRLGDSAQVLPEVLSDIQEPVTFWLDAHYSAGETAWSVPPLLRELQAIAAHPVKRHTILIDDVRLFESEFQVTRAEIQKLFPGSDFYLIDGGDARFPQDVLVCVQGKET